MIDASLIRKKDLEKKTCPHVFLECVKNVKGLLKDNDFV